MSVTTDVVDAEAIVTVGDGNWMRGWDAEDRMPLLGLDVLDPCGSAYAPIVAPSGGTGTYRVVPYAGKAYIDPRALTCAQDDDDSWAAKALKEAGIRVAGAGLCYQAADGNEAWIGDSRVQESPRVASSSGAALAAEVSAARSLWISSSVGTRPILHVSDDMLPLLVAAQVIIFDSNADPKTIWGDDVYNNPGYLSEVLFWSGPFEIYLSSVEEESVVSPANNSGAVSTTILAVVDISPSRIVRLGPLPTSPAI